MPLADALKRGETSLTLWSFLHAKQPLEFFARSGVDSIVLDSQHGAYGESDLVDSIGVCKSAQKPVLVRVPVDRPDLVSRVLDFGADGVIALGADGLRGDLTLIRAARALAALDGDASVECRHLRRVAPAALRHRLRRNPLDDAGSTVRVERAVAEQLPA